MIGAREMGALLGAGNAVAIALVFAAFGPSDTECGLLDCPWFVDPNVPAFSTTFLVVLMLAMPVGMLCGIGLGVIARDMDPEEHPIACWIQVTVIALMLATFSALPWHALIAYSYGPTVLHTSVLVWWMTRLARAPDGEVLGVGVGEVEAGHRRRRVHRV